MKTQHTPGRAPRYTVHTGDDYTVIMLGNEVTDSASISIHGTQAHRLKVAARVARGFDALAVYPDMFEALRLVRLHLIPGIGKHATVKQKWAAMAAVREALARVEPQ